MRLVTFTHSGSTRLGVLNGDSITDLSRAAPELPTEMNAFLRAGDSAMETARATTGRPPRAFPGRKKASSQF